MDKDLVTLRQAADTLNIPKDRIRGWVRRGRLTSQIIDGAHHVDLGAVIAVATEANPTDPAPVVTLGAQIELASRFEAMNREWLERLDTERQRSDDEYRARVIAETQVEHLRAEIVRLEGLKPSRWWRKS